MGKVFAVAVNTIRQALRMKIALVFMVLLLILLPLLAWGTTGDGSPKGRLQTFISYGLSLTSLLLSVLTIFVILHTTTSDLVHKQVFTVLSKPIRRWQFILGKFMGVVFLDLILLIGFTCFIYVYVVMAPRFMDMTMMDAFQLDTQFFTARAGLRPKEPEVAEADIDRMYDELERYGELERFFEEGIPKYKIKKQLRNVAKLEKTAAAPGHDLLWEFNNVRLFDPNDRLFVRFKYEVAVNPLDLQIYSHWEVGDNRQYQSDQPATTPIWQEDRKDAIRTATEFAVPASVIAEDGYLGVRFENVAMNTTTVIFPLEDGLEVMYQTGTFFSNYLRAVLLILFRLIFLTAIGVFASSFLSFPVAILLCTMIFVTVTVSGFITESFTYLNEDIGRIYNLTIAWIINLLPKFDQNNPTTFLVGGRLITKALVAKAALIMVALWGSVSVALGLWIFSTREVARTD
jgi:ABC-type transport system involved in multi-copper enzyme maturation permease subunit